MSLCLTPSDVTRYLQLLLRKEGLIFKTSAELEIVRTIKACSCCGFM
jgi:centractin